MQSQSTRKYSLLERVCWVILGAAYRIGSAAMFVRRPSATILHCIHLCADGILSSLRAIAMYVRNNVDANTNEWTRKYPCCMSWPLRCFHYARLTTESYTFSSKNFAVETLLANVYVRPSNKID